MKKDIQNRADIDLLIDTFYAKIRKDDLLGSIFNNAIANWDHHLIHLADFWETNLFAAVKFKGNPVKAHQEVAINHKHTIEAKHFGVWLQHWFQTIDQLFEGEKAEIAKRRAQKMSTFLLLKMFEVKH